MDDLIIFSSSLQEHIDRLTEIFERLKNANLKLQPDKCEFLKKEVTNLGHIVTKDGVKTNPEKIKAVKEFPIPRNTEEIKSFLGLAGYYRRFIPEFAKIVMPLTQLLKKEIKFYFDEICLKAFNSLKEKSINYSILQYSDFEKEFIITTDASNFALGAILSQGEIGKDLPSAYASRTLNRHEEKLSVIKKKYLESHGP